MNPKRVTIEDVAQVAGVSRQTVSRAINNRGEISPETRTRILHIAEEMGYRPNSLARGLATQRTRTLGLVVPDNSNPFFSEVARGAEHIAYTKGYSVFLCNTAENTQRELAVLQSLEEKRVDGIMLCSSRLDEKELHKAIARHPAVVLVNRRLARDAASVILIDDEVGGRMATHHLLQAGHRAIGFLAGPAASHSSQQRIKGYLSTLTATNIQTIPDWMRHCAPTVRGGREVARTLLTDHPELTALFCYNDLVAVGALQAGVELGRSVPDSLAVVGFDDIPLAALVTPALTTCCVPRHELGVQAMQSLLDRIEGCRNACAEIVLSPQLVIRASAP